MEETNKEICDCDDIGLVRFLTGYVSCYTTLLIIKILKNKNSIAKNKLVLYGLVE